MQIKIASFFTLSMLTLTAPRAGIMSVAKNFSIQRVWDNFNCEDLAYSLGLHLLTLSDCYPFNLHIYIKFPVCLILITSIMTGLKIASLINLGHTIIPDKEGGATSADKFLFILFILSIVNILIVFLPFLLNASSLLFIQNYLALPIQLIFKAIEVVNFFTNIENSGEVFMLDELQTLKFIQTPSSYSSKAIYSILFPFKYFIGLYCLLAYIFPAMKIGLLSTFFVSIDMLICSFIVITSFLSKVL